MLANELPELLWIDLGTRRPCAGDATESRLQCRAGVFRQLGEVLSHAIKGIFRDFHLEPARGCGL